MSLRRNLLHCFFPTTQPINQPCVKSFRIISDTMIWVSIIPWKHLTGLLRMLNTKPYTCSCWGVSLLRGIISSCCSKKLNRRKRLEADWKKYKLNRLMWLLWLWLMLILRFLINVKQLLIWMNISRPTSMLSIRWNIQSTVWAPKLVSWIFVKTWFKKLCRNWMLPMQLSILLNCFKSISRLRLCWDNCINHSKQWLSTIQRWLPKRKSLLPRNFPH